ncbi:hypothetical protein BRYFOR_07322 [Marvinbryantia formatexigens DSM 14469]|uniref:Uncharacterized protein n=1 Tax=Marvinbryantia formatexigens DSM 14469 TaxID=478749 RepID=C6LFC0_9FIRM|nr:hypothetical protein BRYFOR_07322 [Marvinbryantia formatexigens DSM 14469]
MPKYIPAIICARRAQNPLTSSFRLPQEGLCKSYFISQSNGFAAHIRFPV